MINEEEEEEKEEEELASVRREIKLLLGAGAGAVLEAAQVREAHGTETEWKV